MKQAHADIAYTIARTQLECCDETRDNSTRYAYRDGLLRAVDFLVPPEQVAKINLRIARIIQDALKVREEDRTAE